MTDITGLELFQTLANIKRLEEIAKNEITTEKIKEITFLLDTLFQNFYYLKHQYSFEQIHRITINKNILKSNKRIKDIGNLKYPPDKTYVTKYGRCNLPQQPIFYGSLMNLTSINELKPKVGDLITESTWTTKSSRPLNYLPIFLNQPTTQPFVNIETGEIIPYLTNIRTLDMERAFMKFVNQYPPNTRKVYLAIMQFIANSFSKPVNSSNHLNYFYSAYLSDKFFTLLENGEIEAIYYPSVPDKLNSENLAIKPASFEDLYQLSKVDESIVFQDPSDGRGGYGMDSVASCSNFNYATNEILWSGEKYNFSEEKFGFYQKKFGLDLD